MSTRMRAEDLSEIRTVDLSGMAPADTMAFDLAVSERFLAATGYGRRTEDRPRRLELEAAEIASRICTILDTARTPAPASRLGPVSPFRAPCLDYRQEQQDLGPSHALEDPHRFGVQIIDDGTGLALFGTWIGESYHEAVLSVPGVHDARFSTATDSWPVGVPYPEQRARHDYWTGLLGGDRADARGVTVTLGMDNDPGFNLRGRLELVAAHQPSVHDRAVSAFSRAVADQALRNLRLAGGYDMEAVTGIVFGAQRAGHEHAEAVTGLTALTVGIIGGVDPTPPLPCVDPARVQAVVTQVMDEHYGETT